MAVYLGKYRAIVPIVYYKWGESIGRQKNSYFSVRLKGINKEKSVKVAICDDSLTEIQYTKEQLENAYKSLDLLVTSFQDGRELINSMNQTSYDLIILDIEMPGLDGLAVAREIRKICDKTAICFLTSHVEYSLKGYEVNAIRYLMKPVKQEQLSEVVNYLLQKNATGKKIMVKDEEDTLLLETETILYLEAQNQDIRIVTSTGEYLKCYNIKDYEKELQECFFERCHRSYLVNLAHIRAITGKDILLDNGERIPCSRTKEKALKDALMTYVKRSAV